MPQRIIIHHRKSQDRIACNFCMDALFMPDIIAMWPIRKGDSNDN